MRTYESVCVLLLNSSGVLWIMKQSAWGKKMLCDLWPHLVLPSWLNQGLYDCLDSCPLLHNKRCFYCLSREFMTASLPCRRKPQLVDFLLQLFSNKRKTSGFPRGVICINLTRSWWAGKLVLLVDFSLKCLVMRTLMIIYDNFFPSSLIAESVCAWICCKHIQLCLHT